MSKEKRIKWEVIRQASDGHVRVTLPLDDYLQLRERVDRKYTDWLMGAHCFVNTLCRHLRTNKLIKPRTLADYVETRSASIANDIAGKLL